MGEECHYEASPNDFVESLDAHIKMLPNEDNAIIAFACLDIQSTGAIFREQKEIRVNLDGNPYVHLSEDKNSGASNTYLTFDKDNTYLKACFDIEGKKNVDVEVIHQMTESNQKETLNWTITQKCTNPTSTLEPKMENIKLSPTSITLGESTEVEVTLNTALTSEYSINASYIKDNGNIEKVDLQCVGTSCNLGIIPDKIGENQAIVISLDKDNIHLDVVRKEYSIKENTSLTPLAVTIEEPLLLVSTSYIPSVDIPLFTKNTGWKMTDINYHDKDSTFSTNNGKYKDITIGEETIKEWYIQKKDWKNCNVFSEINKEEVTTWTHTDISYTTKLIKYGFIPKEEGLYKHKFYVKCSGKYMKRDGTLVEKKEETDPFWVKVNVVDTSNPVSEIISYQYNGTYFKFPKGKNTKIKFKGKNFKGKYISVNTDDNGNQIDDINDNYIDLKKATDDTSVEVILNTEIASGVWFFKVGEDGKVFKVTIKGDTKSKDFSYGEEEIENEYNKINNNFPIEECKESSYSVKTGAKVALCEIKNGVVEYWKEFPNETLDIVKSNVEKYKTHVDFISYSILWFFTTKISDDKYLIDELKESTDKEMRKIEERLTTIENNIVNQSEYVKEYFASINYYIKGDEVLKEIFNEYSPKDFVSPSKLIEIKNNLRIKISKNLEKSLQIITLPPQEKEYLIAYLSTHLSYEAIQLANPSKKFLWLQRIAKLNSDKKIKIKIPQWMKYTKVFRNFNGGCVLKKPKVKKGNTAKKCDYSAKLDIDTLKIIIDSKNYAKVLDKRGIKYTDAILFFHYTSIGFYKEKLLYQQFYDTKTKGYYSKPIEKAFSYHHVISNKGMKSITNTTNILNNVDKNTQLAKIISDRYIEDLRSETDTIFPYFSVNPNSPNNMNEYEQNFLNKEWNMIPIAHHIAGHTFNKDKEKSSYHKCVQVETCLILNKATTFTDFDNMFMEFKMKMGQYPIGTISSLEYFLREAAIIAKTANVPISTYNSTLDQYTNGIKIKQSETPIKSCTINKITFNATPNSCYPQVFTNIWEKQ